MRSERPDNLPSYRDISAFMESDKTPMPNAGMQAISTICAQGAASFAAMAQACRGPALPIIVAGSCPPMSGAAPQVNGENARALVNATDCLASTAEKASHPSSEGTGRAESTTQSSQPQSSQPQSSEASTGNDPTPSSNSTATSTPVSGATPQRQPTHHSSHNRDRVTGAATPDSSSDTPSIDEAVVALDGTLVPDEPEDVVDEASTATPSDPAPVPSTPAAPSGSRTNLEN